MELNNMVERLRTAFSKGGDRWNRWIILAGLLGMALILFSSFGGDKKDQAPTENASLTSAEYTAYLEKRLQDVVTSIDGVGRAKVMVTLERGVEYVYAQEEKQNTDRLQDYGNEGASPRKVQEKNSNQVSYILVEGPNGRKQALVEQQLEPKVQGVVVLCQGAGNPVVEQRVTAALKAALDIPANKICVTKLSD